MCCTNVTLKDTKIHEILTDDIYLLWSTNFTSFSNSCKMLTPHPHNDHRKNNDERDNKQTRNQVDGYKEVDIT